MKTHIFLKTALVAGLLAISGTSFAASSTVTTTFTGTVPNTCSMVTGAVGTLALTTDGLGMVSSPGSGGTRGSFTLTCTGTANMTIAAPTPNAGTVPAATPASMTQVANLLTSGGVTIATSDGVTNATSQPSGSYDVQLAFRSINTTKLAPGSYASSVVTTVTPN